MVRVISQGFTTPRSRHSSGEDMIDRFAAMKAVSALNDNEKQSFFKDSNHNLHAKKLIIDCNTDTNDSFSCGESEEDARYESSDKGLQNSTHQPTAVLKKERRRERNKLSAQSYRQRRKVQTSAVQKTLESLESHHKDLLEKVRQLEAEKHIVEEYLKNCVKVPWCPFHQPCKPMPSPPPTILEQCPEPCGPTPMPTNSYSTDGNANMVENGNLQMAMPPSPSHTAHALPSMGNLNNMSLHMSGVSTLQSTDSLVS